MRYFLSVFESADRTLALKITFRYFFQPLYKDYSVVGRILGVIFRTIRIVIGLVIYVFLAILFLAVYLVWIFFPPALVANIFFKIKI